MGSLIGKNKASVAALSVSLVGVLMLSGCGLKPAPVIEENPIADAVPEENMGDASAAETSEIGECGERPREENMDIPEGWAVYFSDSACLAIPLPPEWQVLDDAVFHHRNAFLYPVETPGNPSVQLYWTINPHADLPGRIPIEHIREAWHNSGSAEKEIYDTGFTENVEFYTEYGDQKWFLFFPDLDRAYVVWMNYPTELAGQNQERLSSETRMVIDGLRAY